MNGEKKNTPPVKDFNKKNVDPIIYWVLIAIVLILAVIFVFRGDDTTEVPVSNLRGTSFEDISGIQGTVRYVDYANQGFVVEKITLIEDSGEYQTKRDVFNFEWNENTKFFYYRNSLALGARQPWEVDYTYLTNTRNVIVTLDEEASPEKELMAVEIKILPSFTKTGAMD